jgi:hypothetical protein
MTDKPVQQQLFLADQLIEEHKQDLEDLQSKPAIIPTIEGIIENSMTQGLIQYYQYAIQTLESGLDPMLTIDSLSEEELEQYMREQGYFICSR